MRVALCSLQRGLLGCCLVLSACGGGGGSSPGASLVPISSQPSSDATLPVQIVIANNTGSSSLKRRPADFSATAASATVAVSTASGATTNVTLSCSSSCNGTVSAPPGIITIAVALYDQPNATGNVLAKGTTTSNIVAGQTNRVSIVLGGIVATLGVSLAGALTVGTASAIAVTLQAKDAAGNVIVGPFANAVTLTATDPLRAITVSPAVVPNSSTSATLNYNGSTSFTGGSIAVAAAGAAGASASVDASGVAAGSVCLEGSRYTKSFGDDFTSFSRYDHTTKQGTWDTQYPWGRTNPGTHPATFDIDATFTGSGQTPLGIDPFSQTNGTLTIAAAPAPAWLQPQIQNYAYTSGVMTTRYSFSQQYGYFEARMKLPRATGSISAFWLMPVYGFPPEIDIMENLGKDPTVVYQTTHAADYSFKQEIFTNIDASDGYHTYGVKWTAQEIAYFIDGKVTQRFPNVSNQPMYLLAGLDLGAAGAWEGQPDSTTPMPTTMQINYIRAYQATSAVCTGT